jgi:hypothetical protein
MKRVKINNRVLVILSLTIIGVLLMGFILMVGLSPYKSYNKYSHNLVKVSVNINALPSKVFNYLGNSNNAKDWSVFVSHITTLNPSEKVDGELGSVRRCFTNENETGETWDEEILFIEENRYRKLSCYNFIDFALSSNNLHTEQIYEEQDDGTTELSFTLFYANPEVSLVDELKMHFASYTMASIFKENLANIKSFVEKES